MTTFHFSDTAGQFKKEEFIVQNLQDEIRVDELCSRFLKVFHKDLVENQGLSPLEAGSLAHGADYFLREFVIPDRRDNIFELPPGRVRQFAGNWYIIRNLEPNIAELNGILQGVKAFYRYCQRIGMVSLELAETVDRECADLDYFRQRIDSFWEIQDDGYRRWEEECTLKN